MDECLICEDEGLHHLTLLLVLQQVSNLPPQILLLQPLDSFTLKKVSLLLDLAPFKSHLLHIVTKLILLQLQALLLLEPVQQLWNGGQASRSIHLLNLVCNLLQSCVVDFWLLN